MAQYSLFVLKHQPTDRPTTNLTAIEEPHQQPECQSDGINAIAPADTCLPYSTPRICLKPGAIR